VDQGGIDEDEVKMVPLWKAKGISPIVLDELPSKQQSTLKPGGEESRPTADEGCDNL